MKTVSWIGSFATILGVSISNLLHFWEKASFWMRFFFLVVLFAALALAIIDIQTWWKTRAKRHKNEQSVNKYMLKFLKRGGSLAIFANHLSWIRNAPEIRNFLRSEAGRGRDICICVPAHNDLTEQLATEGVKIKTYSGLGYEPGSRFTLLNPDEPGSSLLAIGKGVFPDFYIQEFSDDTHSRVISVVRDLIKILERVSDSANA